MLNFESNGTHPKVKVLVHFGDQFTVGKPKKLFKTKNSVKSAGISNNVSPRSQKNHRILVKLSEKQQQKQQQKTKTAFGAQIGSNLLPGAASKGYKKFLHIL